MWPLTVTPAMARFEWSPAPGFVPTQAGEDGWCIRDAICQLFGWRPGLEEWLRFIEGPGRTRPGSPSKVRFRGDVR